MINLNLQNDINKNLFEKRISLVFLNNYILTIEFINN